MTGVRADARPEFADFVRGSSPALVGTAVLLAGGDRGHAEDLVQGVLERMYVRWEKIDGPPEAYARRALAHAAVNRWRTRRRRPETPLPPVEPVSARDGPGTVDLRDALVRALVTLPPKQRAVLVLRYLDDLPDGEIAAALDCSVTTVRSHASRGLARLRETAGSLALTTGGTA
jgi:RNA polymerase sigma-70 factor (sigma-E family)